MGFMPSHSVQLVSSSDASLFNLRRFLMGNPQYFSKFTGLLFARGMENARPRRSSPFRLESLEARVLLSGDLGGAMSVADILNSSTFGGQQAVVQNTQPVQVQDISYSNPSPTPALSPATSQS